MAEHLFCKYNKKLLKLESVDGIGNGGFSAADDEISRGGMEKGLFQSPEQEYAKLCGNAPQ